MSVSLREQIANTLFEYRAANLLNKEARDNIATDIVSLIGKCGENEKPIKAIKRFRIWYQTLAHHNPDSFAQLKEIIPNDIINALAEAEATPTFSGEKGEYPCCNMAGTLCPIHGEHNQDVEDCVKGTFMGKPIPAEKEECWHEGSNYCVKCKTHWTPEPKPKDRIEELGGGEYCAYPNNVIVGKINEIIQRINEGE